MRDYIHFSAVCHYAKLCHYAEPTSDKPSHPHYPHLS